MSKYVPVPGPPGPKPKKLTIGTWQFPIVGKQARLKQFTIHPVDEGLILRQRLDGAVAELYQGFRAKPDNLIRFRMPTVFGRSKVITIGRDWIQLGDRIFRADPAAKKPKGS